MKTHYNNEEIEIVYLILPPYGETSKKTDNFINWKSFIKKYPVKGNHMIISPQLYKKLRDSRHKGVVRDTHLFPYNLIVNKQGNIVNNNAHSPIFEKEKLYTELDSTLKQ